MTSFKGLDRSLTMEVIKGVLEDLSVIKQSHKGTYNYSLVQTIELWDCLNHYCRVLGHCQVEQLCTEKTVSDFFHTEHIWFTSSG